MKSRKACGIMQGLRNHAYLTK